MLPHKPRDALRRHALIPRPLGVHDQDRTVRADAQALDLGPIAGIRADAQAQVFVLELLLEFLPRGVTGFGAATVGTDAPEDMPMVMTDAEILGDHGQRFTGSVLGHNAASLVVVGSYRPLAPSAAGD